MLNVIDEHKINLKLVKNINFIKNFNKDELLSIDKFEKLISYADINFNSFIKRY